MSDVVTQNENNKKKTIVGVILLIVCGIILYGFFAGFRANFGMITTIISQIIPGVTYGEVNSLFFIFTIVNGLGTPLMGFLTVKKSYKFVLLLGSIFIAIGLIAIAVATNLAILAIGVCFFLPLGSAALSYAVVFSLVAPSLGMKAAAIGAGVINCSSTFFAMVLAPVIDVLSLTIGFRVCILLFAAVAILFIPLSLIITHKQKAKQISHEDSKKIKFTQVCKEIFSTPVFYVILGCYIIYAFSCQGITNHLFKGLVSAGVDGFTSSILLSIANLAFTIGMIGIGIIAVKSKKHIKLAVSIVVLVAVLEVIFCFIEGMMILALIFLIIICLLGGTFLPIASVIASETINPLYLATALGLLHFIGKVTQGLNYQFGGIIVDLTGEMEYLCILQAIVAVAIAVILIVVTFLIKKKSKKLTPEK